MQADDRKLTANQAIVFREEDDNWAILFNPDTGDTFALNPISVYIWKCLDGEHSVEDVVRKLRQDCIDMPDDAADHIREFLNELVEQGYAAYES